VPEFTSMIHGSIINKGPSNGVNVVGNRNVVEQAPHGPLVSDASPSVTATTAAVDPWRFVLREQTGGRSLKGVKEKAQLEIHPPQAGGQRMEWPVQPQVPSEDELLELDWYFHGQFNDLDPTRARRIESRLVELGEAMFDSIFADAEAKRYVRDALSSGTETVWSIQGSPPFHRFPWEILRHSMGQFSQDIAMQAAFSRRITDPPAFHAQVPTSPKLSVLWFAARVNQDDIPADAVAKSIREEIGEDIDFDLVTDGRYETLASRLWKNRLRPRYHVLHLDMHGIVDSGQDVRLRAANRPGKWIVDDRYGRGNVTDTEVEQAWLFFADAGPNQTVLKDPASAVELANAISESRIPVVVLNACDSATIPDPAPSPAPSPKPSPKPSPAPSSKPTLGKRSRPSSQSALVAELVKAGGFSAVGFSNSLHLVAAQRFFQAFYRTLVQSPDRGALEHAIIDGRRALHAKQARGPLQLVDWSLPVWYASRDIALPSTAKTR
jgi:hypothetical protein